MLCNANRYENKIQPTEIGHRQIATPNQNKTGCHLVAVFSTILARNSGAMNQVSSNPRSYRLASLKLVLLKFFL